MTWTSRIVTPTHSKHMNVVNEKLTLCILNNYCKSIEIDTEFPG